MIIRAGLSPNYSLALATKYIHMQAELPLEFGTNLSMVLALSPDELEGSPGISGEFRSLLFQFTPSNVSNSAIIHIFSTRRNRVRWAVPTIKNTKYDADSMVVHVKFTPGKY